MGKEYDKTVALQDMLDLKKRVEEFVNTDKPLTITEIAKKHKVSTKTLYELYTSQTGKSYKDGSEYEVNIRKREISGINS